ncbi:hypothetical protein JZU68_03800 [bacterium]|nr:hypothetical protein [bacterium]
MGLEGAAIAVGSFVTAGFATGVTAGIIGSAVIGAAIGGLTAAVMGGDIGQGMLFGAIGGAVLGAVTGVGGNIAAEAGVTTAQTTSQLGTALSTTGEFAAETGVATFSPELAMGISENVVAPTMLESLGAQIGVSALEGGAKAYLMKGAAEDKAEGDAAQQTEYLNTLMEKQKLTGEQALQQIAAQKETASAAEKMATDSRMAELDQRKNEFAQTLGFQREQYAQTQENAANRQALFGGTTRRGGMVEDKPMTEGVFDTLQKKPVTALVA